MAEDARTSARNTSLYYPYFQYMFDAADMTAAMWQPMLKAMGRTQLELASLQARQAQAVVHWTHLMLRPASPADFLNASTQLWATFTEQCFEAVPRVAAAVETATKAVVPTTRVLPAAKQTRDTLILLDREKSDEMPERRVA